MREVRVGLSERDTPIVLTPVCVAGVVVTVGRQRVSDKRIAGEVDGPEAGTGRDFWTSECGFSWSPWSSGFLNDWA